MKSTDYFNLAAFTAIAETGSFRKAAARLDMQPSTLSHAMRALETRLGVALLHRTTRHVAPTEAGQALHAQIAPAFAQIAQAVEQLNPYRAHPAGTVRLSVPRTVAERLLAPRFRAFTQRYPDVVLDIAAHNGFVDIVKQGFDAGVRLGECVDKDMVAVRLTPEFRDAVVGAPAYFRRWGTPKTPHDLTGHRCIGWRQGSDGSLYRWAFAKGKRRLNVAVSGPLVLDDADLMLQAALDGVGLAYSTESYCAEHLASGRLVRVLADWCPPYPGFYLYYPSRRHTSAALRALIDMLREPAPNAAPDEGQARAKNGARSPF